MKVVVVTSTFFPDHTGIAVYSTDLALLLQEAGHNVTVVTTFSHYPRWKKLREDVGVLFRTEWYRGIKILRGYSYVPGRPSALKRILHDLSFTAFALVNGVRARGADLVVTISPPLTSGLVGGLVMARREGRIVAYIQDLQLDAAIGLGMLRRGPLTRAAGRLERWLLRRADHVVTIIESMRDRIISKGVEPDTVSVIENWIDVAAAARPGAIGAFRGRFPELGDAPLVGYAGNLGVKQNLAVLVHAARILEDRGSDINVVIVGDGAMREELVKLADTLRLSNTHILPTQTPDEYREFLSDLEIFVLPQAAGANDVFFPSKLLGILARRVPIVLSADLDSELGGAGERSAGAVCIPANDSKALADAILSLHCDKERRARLSASSRAFLDGFDRSRVLKKTRPWLPPPGA